MAQRGILLLLLTERERRGGGGGGGEGRGRGGGGNRKREGSRQIQADEVEQGKDEEVRTTQQGNSQKDRKTNN